jgi:hypothetical protein
MVSGDLRVFRQGEVVRLAASDRDRFRRDDHEVSSVLTLYHYKFPWHSTLRVEFYGLE